jgi:MFS transporter, SP family, general alpha glucoside:H+ symporter
MPFAVQWVWPPVLFVILCFAPESPWWLVRHGHIDRAEKALHRLASNYDSDETTSATVAAMVRTNELEKEMASGTSFLDCFKGIDQ